MAGQIGGKFQGARPLTPEDVAALTLGNPNHIVGVGPTLITPPFDAKTIWVQVDSGSFRVRAGDYVPRTLTSIAAVTDIVTLAGHGFISGSGPYKMTAATTLDTGLTADSLFFIRVLSSSTFTLHTSQEGATGNDATVDLIDLEGDGVGDEIIANHLTPAGEGVGWAPSLIPATAVADGYGSVLLGAGTTTPFSAPAGVTVRGFAAGDALTWWAV